MNFCFIVRGAALLSNFSHCYHGALSCRITSYIFQLLYPSAAAGAAQPAWPELGCAALPGLGMVVPGRGPYNNSLQPLTAIITRPYFN